MTIKVKYTPSTWRCVWLYPGHNSIFGKDIQSWSWEWADDEV